MNPRGPWFLSAISAGVDWQQAAAALVAAAEVRVALVALDPGGPPTPGPATTSRRATRPAGPWPTPRAWCVRWPAHTGLTLVPPPAPARPPVSEKKLVLGLLGVFLVMVLLVCGMAFRGSTETEAELQSITVVDDRPVPPIPSPRPCRSPREARCRDRRSR